MGRNKNVTMLLQKLVISMDNSFTTVYWGYTYVVLVIQSTVFLITIQTLRHAKLTDNCNDARRPENKTKNRYRNVLPCKLEFSHPNWVLKKRKDQTLCVLRKNYIEEHFRCLFGHTRQNS